ncbi:MAG: hydantoinase/oxoprolinase family protein [Bacillota bacterium]
MGDLVLGIDTGGTFTDAVLLDREQQQVVRWAKALTTHRDLAVGIADAVRQLGLAPAQVLAGMISTTLATNAVVEGLTRPVGLALIGYDRELLERFGLERNIFATLVTYFPGGHDVYGRPRPGFDPEAVAAWAERHKPEVEAYAVSAYFSPLDSRCEQDAAAAIRRMVAAPVVLGNEMSTTLGAVRRATTASLNASLLPIALEFMSALREVLDPLTRGPLLCCRGDGTLMRIETAMARPIETVASGPAASAVGATFLAHRPTALVLDVGGTSSDIALVVDGGPRISPQGATVGGYPTALPAVAMRTVGLGGDSRVGPAHPTGEPGESLAIGPERVTPLARLAAQYPGILPQLHAAATRPLGPDDVLLLDYWYLVRDPGDEVGPDPGNMVVPDPGNEAGTLTGPERELIGALSAGPLNLPALLERLRVPHLRLVPWQRLLRKGILARAGLTPTDAMHVTGQYEPWDAEASRLASRLLAGALGRGPGEVPCLVFTLAARILARAVVAYLAPAADEQATPHPGWLVEAALRPERRDTWPLLPELHLDVPLVAVGGAGPVLVPLVAETLHTECLIPPHHPVASATGAAMAKLVARCEGRIHPASPAGGSLVSIDGQHATFFDEERAFAHAREAAARAVRALAAREDLPESGPVQVSLIPEGSGYRVAAALEASLAQLGAC